MVLEEITARDELDFALSDGRVHQILPYSRADTTCGDKLEYCMFLKPELLAASANLPLALEIISSCLPASAEVVGASVLPGGYLDRHDLMAQHYGTINRVSRLGVKAITADVEAGIRREFGAGDDVQILGAHEFLAQHDEYSAASLCDIHDSSENKKVASGTYAVRLEGTRSPSIVLNGFHPAQLNMYYDASAAILVLALRHVGDWSELRRAITGATDPRRAVKSSIRGQLYTRQTELHVEISSLKNGIHVSAGPVEGMSELARYFTDWDVPVEVKAADTCFGFSIAQLFGEDIARRIGENPLVEYRGVEAWIFDLTEEINPAGALGIVKEIQGQLERKPS